MKHISIPEVCPVCGEKTEIRISDSGVKTLWCSNASCDGRLINRLEHIFGKGKIEIKGLSKATFEKLIDLEWIKKPVDVYEVLPKKREEWIKLKGFGIASVDKILKAIEESKNCSLERVICSAGIPLIGSRVSKILANEFLTWDNFRQAIKNEYNFSELEGFGDEMTSRLLLFNYDEIDYIVSNFLSIEEIEKVSIKEKSNLTDKVIVITGKLVNFKNRKELKELIESRGGIVRDSVTSKTSMLINNDTTSQTGKNKAALSAGIPIISETEFMNLYLQ